MVFISSATPKAHPAASPRPLFTRLKWRKKEREDRELEIRGGHDNQLISSHHRYPRPSSTIPQSHTSRDPLPLGKEDPFTLIRTISQSLLSPSHFSLLAITRSSSIIVSHNKPPRQIQCSRHKHIANDPSIHPSFSSPTQNSLQVRQRRIAFQSLGNETAFCIADLSEAEAERNI